MKTEKYRLYTDIRLEVLRRATLEFPDWAEFLRDALGEQRCPLYAGVAIDLSRAGLVETQSTLTAVRARSTQRQAKLEEKSSRRRREDDSIRI